MERYRVKRFFRKLVILTPLPKFLLRVFSFVWLTKRGEDFADMSLNGEVRVIKLYAPECRVIFDVGANRGDWTAHAVKASEGARIYSFEPLQALYEMLTARAFPSRVRCLQLGLSDASGERQLDRRTTSLYRREPFKQHESDQMETIRVVTLDEFCAAEGVERIDFLKVDVEGHELAVLQGGHKMISSGNVLRIQFEYSRFNIFSKALLVDFFRFFDGLPFRLFQIMTRKSVPLAGYDPGLENFQYKNFIALHHSVSRNGG
jgi:FkbM family methyltransferase